MKKMDSEKERGISYRLRRKMKVKVKKSES